MTLPEWVELAEDQLAELIAAHPDVAQVRMNVSGTISDWNAAADALFGWTREEAIGHRMLDLTVPTELHPTLHASHEKHVELEGGLQRRRFEVDHVDRRGRHFLAECHCYPVVTGDTTDLYAFVREVSAPERSPAERRLAAIVASSADAILAVDADRLVTDWNPAAEKLLGWPRAAMVGMPIDAVVPPALREQSRAAMRVAQQSAGHVRVETARLHRDGSLVDVEVTLTRLDDPGGSPACTATYRDLSEHRRAEHALAERHARLRAQSLADPDELESEWQVIQDARPDTEPSLVEQVLSLAREHLAMDVVWLSELTGDEQRFEAFAGDAASFGLSTDQTLPRAHTVCARLVAGETGSVHGDLRSEPVLGQLPGVQELPVGAYLGVPVHLRDGRTFGTLCAVDHRSRSDLSERDADLMRLLAGLLAGQIDRRRDEAVEERARAEVTALSALLAALEARDEYTGEHSHAVVQLALGVAAALGTSEDEIEMVGHVATLHDLGKVGIPDAVLLKPGPLTDVEWDLMREHPAIGARIVAALAPLAHLAPAIRAEHERWDGRGYPDGLSGERIPLAARITFACDAYHAMTSDRPYRRALSSEAALAELSANAGSQFDPKVVGALVHALGGG